MTYLVLLMFIFTQPALVLEQQGTIQAIGSNSSQRIVSSPCDCKVTSQTKQIEVWLALAVQLDHCCENYGPLFGLPDDKTCPESIEDVNEAVKRGVTEAEGGQSGTAPIFAGDYVIKLISKEESGQLNALLEDLRTSPLERREVSLLVPTCRLIQVALTKQLYTKLYYVQVSPKVHLEIPQQSRIAFEQKYDLKGNWDWTNRNAKPKESMKKDANFRNQFPGGLQLTTASFPGRVQVTEDQNTPSPLFMQLKKDTNRLLRLRLMDYSILVHLVEVPRDFDAVWEANVKKNKPVFAATSQTGGLYIMTLGIIDMLMHEEKRGFGNKFVAAASLAQCSPKDVDPIPARPYMVRFLRMLGWQDPQVDAKGKKQCGACLGSRTGYAYFTSSYQLDQSKKENACEWGPAFENYGLPK